MPSNVLAVSYLWGGVPSHFPLLRLFALISLLRSVISSLFLIYIHRLSFIVVRSHSLIVAT